MSMLKGYLSYTLAVAAIVYGVVGVAMGWISMEVAVPIIWSGLAVFGIRRAIENS